MCQERKCSFGERLSVVDGSWKEYIFFFGEGVLGPMVDCVYSTALDII